MTQKDSQLTFVIVLLIIMGIGTFYFFLTTQGIDISKYQIIKPKPKEPVIVYPGLMKINSLAFENNQMIPEKYTCKGLEVNPPLSITEVPQNALSLVLIVDDPDAPYKTWTHWLVFNIDPKVRSIQENGIPFGAQLGENDFGKGEYGGPCPPIGKHRYIFKIFALDIKLELESGASRDKIEDAMKDHILDKAELVGVFEK